MLSPSITWTYPGGSVMTCCYTLLVCCQERRISRRSSQSSRVISRHQCWILVILLTKTDVPVGLANISSNCNVCVNRTLRPSIFFWSSQLFWQHFVTVDQYRFKAWRWCIQVRRNALAVTNRSCTMLWSVAPSCTGHCTFRFFRASSGKSVIRGELMGATKCQKTLAPAWGPRNLTSICFQADEVLPVAFWWTFTSGARSGFVWKEDQWWKVPKEQRVWLLCTGCAPVVGGWCKSWQCAVYFWLSTNWKPWTAKLTLPGSTPSHPWL